MRLSDARNPITQLNSINSRSRTHTRSQMRAMHLLRTRFAYTSHFYYKLYCNAGTLRCSRIIRQCAQFVCAHIVYQPTTKKTRTHSIDSLSRRLRAHHRHYYRLTVLGPENQISINQDRHRDWGTLRQTHTHNPTCTDPTYHEQNLALAQNL